MAVARVWDADNSQWIVISAGQEGPEGPMGPTGATGPAGADSTVPGPAGPTGPSGQAAGRIFYATTDPSDIAGYLKALSAPSSGAETTIAVSASGTSDVLIGSFVTEPGEPGVVDYPTGTAYRRFYAMVSAGVARLHLRVFVRTEAGVETLARDEFSSNFLNTTVALQEWLASAPAGGAMGITDRIVCKLYAQRVSGPGTITVTTFYEGTSHVSHVQTTISAGAQGPVGPVGPIGPEGPPGADAPVGTYLPLTGGTMSGPIELADDPTTDSQAATKAYVDAGLLAIPPPFSGLHADLLDLTPDDHHTRYTDAEASAAIATEGAYLPIAGGDMGGFVVLSDDPTDSLHAATKQYVDAGDAALLAVTDGLSDAIDVVETTYLPLAGGTLSGDLVLAADPDNPMEAATKQYVDATISPDHIVDPLEPVSPGDGLLWTNPTEDAALPSGAQIHGGIQMFAGTTPPSGWLFCNGASHLRADYPDLFTVIGTVFGAVDGTHFNVPDLRTKFPVGVQAGGEYDLGDIGGAATVALVTAEVGSHSHGVGTLVNAGHGHTDGFAIVAAADHDHTISTQTVAVGAHGHQGNAGSAARSATTSGGFGSGTGTGTNGGHGHTLNGAVTATAAGTPAISGSTGTTAAATAHENRPPFLALNFIIYAGF